MFKYSDTKSVQLCQLCGHTHKPNPSMTEKPMKRQWTN